MLQESSVGLAAYQNYIDNLDTFQLECNFCHSRGECVKDGHYQRGYLVSPEDLKGIGKKIFIQRVKCKHCTHTHALLPEEIVPYRQYSIIFISLVLFVLFLGELSINSICKMYSISIRQLKQWKELYTQQKDRFLGVLTSKRWTEKDVVSWFRELKDYGSDFAKQYFSKTKKMPAQTHINPTNMARPVFF